MLLTIDPSRLGVTASRRTPKTAVLAIGALDASLNPAPAGEEAGIKAGIATGLRAAWTARVRPTGVMVVNARAEIQVQRCFIAQ